MKIEIVKVESFKDDFGVLENRITLSNGDGDFFIVNIPDYCWEDINNAEPHGLNLVFGHGCHYQ